MVISELILMLEQIKKENGDIFVLDYDFYDIRNVKVREKSEFSKQIVEEINFPKKFVWIERNN